MVTLAFVLATIVTPVSILILAILLFPWTPQFVLKRFSKYLWDLSLTINSYRFKLVHLMLLVSFVMAVSKGNGYYEILSQQHEHLDYSLAVDFKMKANRCGRDFYIMCNLLAIWVYIWRVIPLISNLVK